jgi:hypothetical protein
VEDSKSPPQRPQRLRSRNFLGKLPEEAVGDRAAPEQRKLGRAALLMMLVTGQGETTFPTSLCEGPTGQGTLHLPGGLTANRGA